MTTKEQYYIDELVNRYPKLEPIKDKIAIAYELIRDTYENGGKLLVAGNGGSASDSEHIVGELMKRFEILRPLPNEFKEKLIQIDGDRGKELAEKLEGSLPAIALITHEALTTAYSNDVDGKLVVAQQLSGYGKCGDVFIGISTSGNSENILYAMVAAKALGLKTIGLTGRDGGALAKMVDVSVIVPEQETYRIQELHLPIYHCWCRTLEGHFFC